MPPRRKQPAASATPARTWAAWWLAAPLLACVAAYMSWGMRGERRWPLGSAGWLLPPLLPPPLPPPLHSACLQLACTRLWTRTPGHEAPPCHCCPDRIARPVSSCRLPLGLAACRRRTAAAATAGAAGDGRQRAGRESPGGGGPGPWLARLPGALPRGPALHHADLGLGRVAAPNRGGAGVVAADGAAAPGGRRTGRGAAAGAGPLPALALHRGHALRRHATRPARRRRAGGAQGLGARRRGQPARGAPPHDLYPRRALCAAVALHSRLPTCGGAPGGRQPRSRAHSRLHAGARGHLARRAARHAGRHALAAGL